MSLHDYRTKPSSEWTYYVVDHLPGMDNIYRYDTIDEAIEKFESLPDDMISAIGSSIDGLHELDHVHRRNGEPVLVTDMYNVDVELWRNSKEINEGISKIISLLGIEYELSKEIFGNMRPSVAIPLCISTGGPTDKYYLDKSLRLNKGDHPATAINEVFVRGEGWINFSDFIDKLENCKPKRIGLGSDTLFVDRLNVNYVTDKGHIGQADLSPENYLYLKEKYERGDVLLEAIKYNDTANYEYLNVLNVEGVFTSLRISRDSLPEGFHKYSLREGDTGWFSEISSGILLNHAGDFITKEPIDFGNKNSLPLSEKDYSFSDKQFDFESFFGQKLSINCQIERAEEKRNANLKPEEKAPVVENTPEQEQKKSHEI